MSSGAFVCYDDDYVNEEYEYDDDCLMMMMIMVVMLMDYGGDDVDIIIHHIYKEIYEIDVYNMTQITTTQTYIHTYTQGRKALTLM